MRSVGGVRRSGILLNFERVILMRAQAHITSRKKQGGVALLEALIAIFLFSLGILALVGLQATMSKNVTQAKLRGEASFLANQLIGQMWVDQVNLSNYVITASACAIAYPNCSNWRTAVGQVLPNSGVDVTVNGSAVNITLSWTLPGEAPGQFQIGANITN
jgi:type IV pilus assembly protein PilV